MREFLIVISIIFTPLVASLIPSKSYTTVTSVNGYNVTLANKIGIKYQTALVVRTLSNGDFATAYIMQTSSNQAKIVDTDPTNGDNLANIKPAVKVGDKVIGGFLYDKVVILANNKESFNQIQTQLGINSLTPDTFAAFLKANNQNYPNSNSYKKFAKMVGVGLFIIQKNNSIEVYDPISEKILSKMDFKNRGNKDIKPFYSTFTN